LLWDEAADGGLLGYGQQQSFSSTVTNTAATSYISPFDSSPFAENEVADIADSHKELKILQVEKNHLNSIILCGSGTDVYKRYQADRSNPDEEMSELLTLYCENDEGSNLFDTMYLIRMGGKHRSYIEKLRKGDFEKDGIYGKSGNIIKMDIRKLDDKIHYLQILVTEEIKATDSSSSGPKYKIPSIDELEKAMELELMPKEDPNSWLKWYYGIDEWMGEKLSDAASWVGELRFKKDQYNYIEGEAYNPILPIQWVQDIFESITNKLRENKGDIVKGVTKFNNSLKQAARKLDSLASLSGLPDFIIRFVKRVNSFIGSIIDFVAEIAAKIDTLFEEFAAAIVDGLRIVNALLCGLIDGLLSLVEGLLQLIAFLVDNVIGWILGMDTDESVSSEGRMKSMNRLEAIEDIYDVLVENWGKAVAAIKVFFTTLSWDKLKDLFNDVFANVTRYEVAHFVGSCIFDIIAGVLLAIVTGGGSAIAQAATKAEKFIKLLQLIGREAISAVTLGVYDLAMLLKAFFVRLAKAAAGGFEAMYQFFKRLINGFFEVGEGAVKNDEAIKKMNSVIDELENEHSKQKNRTKTNGGESENFNPIHPKLKEMWIRYLEKRGVIFEIGTPYAISLLENDGCSGLFVRKVLNSETNEWERTIYLFDNPSTGAFLEECYHAVQSLEGLPKYMPPVTYNGKLYENFNGWEYLAKKRILDNADKIGLSYEEYRKLEDQLLEVLENKY
jgi:hypothetical protein